MISQEPITSKPTVAGLSEREAMRLAQRVAAWRGLSEPAVTESMHGYGGLQLDVTAYPGQERVVWATVGKSDGLLALFANDRLLGSADASLAEVVRVQPLQLPGMEQVALMVDDRYDERLGGFSYEERRHIYVWDGRRLRKAFSGMIKGEQLAHAQWANANAPNVWRLRRTTGDFHIQSGLLTMQKEEQELEAVGLPRKPAPPERSYRLIRSQRETDRYQWNPRLRRFERI